MSFVNTIWLWGLGALLIPLLIHLWNKQKTAILPFGSVRFLTESTSSQSKRIQFNEFWLFLIRALLLVFTVLFLVGLFIKQEAAKESWLIIGEGIEVPEELKNKKDRIISSLEIAENREVYDGWSYLLQLAQQHPEVDSLLWLDNFEETNFVGSIPQLPFYLKLLSRSSLNKANKLIEKTDTLHYTIEGLNKPDSLMIEKVLKTIASYVASPMVFKKSTDSWHLTFSSEIKGILNGEMNFMLTEHLFNDSKREYISDKKLIFLSKDLFDDKRKQQQLLLIIAEHIADFQVPNFNFEVENRSSEYADLAINTKVDYKGNFTKWPLSDELLFLLILSFLLIERYMVFRKSRLGE